MDFLDSAIIIGGYKFYYYLEGGFGFLIAVLVGLLNRLGIKTSWRAILAFIVGGYLFSLIGMAIAAAVMASIGDIKKLFWFLGLQSMGGMLGWVLIRALFLVFDKNSGLRS